MDGRGYTALAPDRFAKPWQGLLNNLADKHKTARITAAKG
jgi:hypothetical protein